MSGLVISDFWLMLGLLIAVLMCFVCPPAFIIILLLYFIL